MNPVIYRRYLNILNQRARKKRQQQVMTVSVKDKYGNELGGT